MNIISGFYEIPEGMVLINGEDIQKYRKDDLFSKYNYALQQNIVLDDTIKANIDIKENLKENDFQKIIKNAELEEDIEKLEEKEETLVGEKGGKTIWRTETKSINCKKFIKCKRNQYL